MDSLPTRTSTNFTGNELSPSRRESKKSALKPLEPRKEKSTPTRQPLETSKSIAAKNQPLVQTKIPMKRTLTSLPSKPAGTPRGANFQKTQMKSASKISLTIKEIGGKKSDVNTSKLSFKAPPSISPKLPQSVNSTKSSCARSSNIAGISRRSASTVSSRSTCSQKNDNNDNVVSIPYLPKVTSSSGDHQGPRPSARGEHFPEGNKLKMFESLHKKLEDMQSEFMRKFENLNLSSAEKLKREYRFITMVRNDECKLVVKEADQLRMPTNLQPISFNDFKDRITDLVNANFRTLLTNLRDSQTNGCDSSHYFDELSSKLDVEKEKQLNEMFRLVNEMSPAKENPESHLQIVKMQKEIQDAKKAQLSSEKLIAETNKSHSEEIIKRDIQIAELQKKIKSVEKQNEKLKSTVQLTNEENSHEQSEKTRLREELNACRENIQTLNKKITHYELQLTQERKEKQECIDCLRKFEADLEASNQKIADLVIKAESAADEKVDLEEITNLKAHITELERDKQCMANEVERMRRDSVHLFDMKNKLTAAEDRILELQVILEERSRLSQDKVDFPKEIQNELAKLRQSESEKRREIDKLKVELSKAHFNICQLEEQIQRDQQLLEVRSDLINSLQTNENSQRINLDEMFAQVGEKTNTINELNNELRTKSEEFRNLFTTLGTKQLELSRQEHMIKLLEESNERSQMLRVKQEEKIGRMEEEIAHLKQTVAIYQNNVLGNAGCKSIIFAPITPADEYNENFYYYTSERRRKRQVDINVKKYDT